MKIESISHLGIQPGIADARDSTSAMPGLAHVAWKLGTDLHLLKDAKQHLEPHGVKIRATMDHRVTKPVHFSDPAGNPLEVFVESDPSVWRSNPALVAPGGLLEI